MPEYLEKLRPDRDLQCYFERPSAIAALSEASASGFRVSGCWRQQFDWTVLEWTRDNVFEHPALRNLPDGDLSGLKLVYEEERNNCIALDASWYPTVDWPYLRIWAEQGGVEHLYRVPLRLHATPVEGDFQSASASFALQGTVTAGDYVEMVWQGQHITYLMSSGDTADTAVIALADAIRLAAGSMTASADGPRITLLYPAAEGANGNRVGVYTNVHGAGTETWEPAWGLMGGGASPSKWRIELDFANLWGYLDPDRTTLVRIPTAGVRKMRWTWAADIQAGNFARSEFAVNVSGWSVTGTGRRYSVAGPGSRRIEDNAPEAVYSGAWQAESRGNFSGSSIRHTTSPGARVECTYVMPGDHAVYLGTRKAPGCGPITVVLDGGAPATFDLRRAEDVLVRLPLGTAAGQAEHTVTVTHAGEPGDAFYFDFLEMAVPAEELSAFRADGQTTLATDWDTDHSLALAPERTAWLISKLGFAGRANHYVGAMWWYELSQPGQQYASATVTFSGTPAFSSYTYLRLGPTVLTHLNLIGDTAENVAKAFELELNAGASGVWARAEGGVLTITARAMGSAGNGLEIAASTGSEGFSVTASGPLGGGVDGACRVGLESLPDAAWVTDTEAELPLNRAARDWHRSYFAALRGYGIEVTAALSMELRHGDPSASAGIAQRYPDPDGTPAWLNTPALQTNFSPASTAFWKGAYLGLANVMAEAGVAPYLQFGEVQWWYFPLAQVGMPFYDGYTTSAFHAAYDRPMHVFVDRDTGADEYPEECGFLAGLIGQFTDAVMAYVRQTHAGAKFEVLYPPDVNDAPLTRAVNFPAGHWGRGN